ncbi:uncharacterized protein LOC130672886 [Microplitis mediator]|uniref:uncharacterized protein LOC130672886 n=1 Tax=Microplitis mediator TaxID=375433 RepID=UPI002553CD5A|nr:uncharacterized protein LOC130672886 [Microplitis mediator]
MKTILFTCFIVVANLSLQVFATPLISPKENGIRYPIMQTITVIDDRPLRSVVRLLTPIIGNVSMIGRNYNDVIEEYNRINFDHLSKLTETEVNFLVDVILENLDNYESKIAEKYYYVHDFVKFKPSPPLVFNGFERFREAASIVFKNYHSVIDQLSQPSDLLNFVRLYKNEITAGIGFLIRLTAYKRVEDALNVYIHEIVSEEVKKGPVTSPEYWRILD